MNKTLVIIGAGGHGKVCAEIAQRMNRWHKIYFYDDIVKESVNDIEIINRKDFKKEYEYFVAIGDNYTRKNKFKELKSENLNIVNLIDPNAIVSKHVEFGVGIVIMPGAVINSSVTISDGSIVNSGSIVEHDCVVGEFTHLSPNVTITGKCKVGNNVWIGSSATIINSVIISDDIIVGACSLVNKSIFEKGVYYGIPVKQGWLV